MAERRRTPDSERVPGEKTRRPRDELGRLLPWGSENRLEMEDFDELPVEECHRLAKAHFNEGRFFPAHEAWESAWKQAKGTEEEELFKGLSQLGAGYVHYRRGNPHGAKTLLRRGLGRIRPYAPERRGIDLATLAEAVEGHATMIERAERADGSLPEISFPKV